MRKLYGLQKIKAFLKKYDLFHMGRGCIVHCFQLAYFTYISHTGKKLVQ